MATPCAAQCLAVLLFTALAPCREIWPRARKKTVPQAVLTRKGGWATIICGNHSFSSARHNRFHKKSRPDLAFFLVTVLTPLRCGQEGGRPTHSVCPRGREPRAGEIYTFSSHVPLGVRNATAPLTCLCIDSMPISDKLEVTWEGRAVTKGPSRPPPRGPLSHGATGLLGA